MVNTNFTTRKQGKPCYSGSVNSRRKIVSIVIEQFQLTGLDQAEVSGVDGDIKDEHLRFHQNFPLARAIFQTDCRIPGKSSGCDWDLGASIRTCCM